MDQEVVFLVVLGMAAVTYISRLLPVWFLSSRSLPALVTAWLGYVPVAVLAAMLAPSLLVTAEQHISLSLDNLFLWAALPTFIVAWRTRSLFGSVVAGMVVLAAARYILG